MRNKSSLLIRYRNILYSLDTRKILIFFGGIRIARIYVRANNIHFFPHNNHRLSSPKLRDVEVIDLYPSRTHGDNIHRAALPSGTFYPASGSGSLLCTASGHRKRLGLVTLVLITRTGHRRSSFLVRARTRIRTSAVRESTVGSTPGTLRQGN